MKKTLFCLAVLTAALVSCQKNEMPASEEVQGIPMTLTASLSGELGTKTTVSPDGTGLKSTWDATEKISVVTLSAADMDAKLVSVDTFTSTGTAGRTDAEFSGTFTGGTNPAKVIVIYPALEESDGTYKTPAYTGEHSVLAGGLKNGHQFTNCESLVPLTQASDNNCDHFKNYCIATGDVNLEDIQTGKLSVTMQNLMTVLKIVATFPDSYKNQKLGYVAVSAYMNTIDTEHKWAIFGTGKSTAVNLVTHFFRGALSSEHIIYSDFSVPNTGVATLYMPVPLAGSYSEGTWFFSFTSYVGSTTFAASRMLPKTVHFEAGKMYTANVTFSE